MISVSSGLKMKVNLKLLTTFEFFHLNLKLTHEKSKVSVNFLYVTVSMNCEEFEADLYCKVTDYHKSFEFNYVHPIHNKKLTAYS